MKLKLERAIGITKKKGRYHYVRVVCRCGKRVWLRDNSPLGFWVGCKHCKADTGKITKPNSKSHKWMHTVPLPSLRKLCAQSGTKVGLVSTYTNHISKQEWATFDVFYRDMYRTHKKGLSLLRHDTTMPHSKQNSYWGKRPSTGRKKPSPDRVIVRRKKQGAESTIYFIQHIILKHVKIGITTNIDNRFYHLNQANARLLELVHTRVGDREVEKALHKKYAGRRIEGTEWFHLTDEQLTKEQA